LTAAYLWAISLAYLGPEKIRERVAAASAAAGHEISNEAAVGIVTARYLPIMVVFGLLLLVALPLVQSAGVFTVIRRANREFAPVDVAVRFALPRLGRLISWSLVAGLLTASMVMVTLLPGVVAQSRDLFTVGTAVGAVLAVAVGGSLLSVLLGVVLVEGRGLKRCLELLRGRWLATGVRMLVFGAVYWGYQLVSEWLVGGVVGLVGTGLVPAVVTGLSMIPAVVAQVVVSVVTYAELRGRADGTGTGGLAAGLVERRSSGPAAALSFGGPAAFGGPTATAISVMPRRRWRGFGWAAPTLVMALILGAGGPGLVGASVLPVAAVSPVPAGVEGDAGGGGSGGDSGGDAGSKTSVSGALDSGSKNDSGGDSEAPEPKAKSTPDSKASEDSGGDSAREAARTVTTPDTSQPDSDATGGSGPERQEVARSGAVRGAEQGSRVDSAAPVPPSETGAVAADPTVATTGPVRGAQQGSHVGVAATRPPGAVPENSNVAAGVPGVKPEGPEATAVNTESELICRGSFCAVVPATSREAVAPNAPAPPKPTAMEAAHMSLDMAGMSQHWSGSVADGLNAGLYASEGEWGDALISGGAAVPLGDVTKLGRAAKTAERIKALRAAHAGQMTPALRKNLDNRLEELKREGKLVEGNPADAARRETLAQGDNPALKDCLNSFTATTLVLMADGTRKPIKDVARGNTVLATDPVTGERGPREVTDLIRHGGMHTMVAVQFAGAGQLDATDKHPFWVASQRKWVDAIDLKPGDVVLSDRGDQIKVANLKTSKQDLTAYNLTVAGLHTYYTLAGQTPILVHNSDCPNGKLSDRLPEGMNNKIASAYDDVKAGRIPSHNTYRGGEHPWWAGAKEYRVPGRPETERILEKELPNGAKAYGWTNTHYRKIQRFGAPHFPDSGWK
jgi:hypothetical protein